MINGKEIMSVEAGKYSELSIGEPSGHSLLELSYIVGELSLLELS